MALAPISQQETRVADLISHIIRTYWYSACYSNEGGDGLLVDTTTADGAGEFELILFKKGGQRHDFTVSVTLNEVGWDK